MPALSITVFRTGAQNLWLVRWIMGLLVMVMGGAKVGAQGLSDLIRDDSASVRAMTLMLIQEQCKARYAGRGYVRGGDSLAADWLIRQFQQAGLQRANGSYQHRFQFPVRVFEKEASLKLAGRAVKLGDDFVPWADSPEVNGTFSVTLADSSWLQQTRLKLGQLKPTDALAFPQSLKRSLVKVLDSIKAEEGGAMLGPGMLISLVKRPLWTVGTDVAATPGLDLVASSHSLEQGQLVTAKWQPTWKQHHARNVMALVAGTERPDSVVVVSAHYDHLGGIGPKVYFPGANDNASGVATLLQLAQLVKQYPLRHSVLFVGFAGEEAGLIGSHAMVQQFQQATGISLQQVSLVLNLDLLSAGDKGGMVVNATENKRLHNLMLAANASGQYLPEIRGRGQAANSDHYWFARAGVPAIYFYTMGGTPYYHDVRDEPRNITLTHAKRTQELLLRFLLSATATPLPTGPVKLRP